MLGLLTRCRKAETEVDMICGRGFARWKFLPQARPQDICAAPDFTPNQALPFRFRISAADGTDGDSQPPSEVLLRR